MECKKSHIFVNLIRLHLHTVQSNKYDGFKRISTLIFLVTLHRVLTKYTPVSQTQANPQAKKVPKSTSPSKQDQWRSRGCWGP